MKQKSLAMKKYSVAVVALAAMMTASVASAGGGEPPGQFDELPSEGGLPTNPTFAYSDPDVGQLGIHLPNGSIVVDYQTNRLYMSNERGQMDVSLEEAAAAYAQYYGGGNPQVAQQFLTEMRNDLLDQSQLFTQTFDANGNGFAEESSASLHGCLAYNCNTYSDGFDRGSLFTTRDDYWDLGRWGDGPPAPPPPPEREDRKEDCWQEARDLKSLTDSAFVGWGLACSTMAYKPFRGGAACVAGGAAAAKVSQKFARKVKECQAY